MLSGSLTSTLRPIRIAFVIQPWDRAAALQAMQTSSLLWGGAYNPIIPFHQRINRRNRFFAGAQTAHEVFEGYLRAYDPDFVVRLGSTKQANINLSRYREIGADEILYGVTEDETPGYGVGIFEILSHLLDEEFRFVRREKISFDVPEVHDSLLWTSIFGGVPAEFRALLDRRLRAFPDYRSVPCENRNYLHHFRRENHFLRRLTGLDIEVHRKGYHDDWIYLIDGTSVEDIVYYWNLRALGWQILPVPIAASGSPEVRSRVEQYIEENYWPYRRNASMRNYTTLLKAPSVTEKEQKDFAEALELKATKSNDLDKFAIQTWIPRIWNEWDRRQNGVDRRHITVKKADVKLLPDQNCFYFHSLFPDFAAEHSGQGTPRCANELEPRIYGETGTYAEAIPEGGELLAREAVQYSCHEFRCSADGLVHYPWLKNWESRLELPLAESVFQGWFKERGWETVLSDNGHIIKHLLKQFGGFWGSKWLTNEAVIKLLNEITSKKWLGQKEFRSLIHQTAKKAAFADADRLTKWLVDSNIVKLGVELACPQCRQRSWFSVSEADYKVDCHQCLESFNLPSESPEKIRWAYRGHGAFKTRFGTQGALAVILTLHLFSRSMSDQVTPMFSFLAKNGSEKMEVDLALHTRRMRGGMPERNVLFVECKSYNEFEKGDIERMETFTRSFPGSAMVFATLRRELSRREITMLTRVAKRNFNSRIRGGETSPLIILTGNELFSWREPWDTWKEMGGRFSRYGYGPSHQEEIEALAEATQFLYLGFDSAEMRQRPRTRK